MIFGASLSVCTVDHISAEIQVLKTDHGRKAALEPSMLFLMLQ